MRQSKTKSSNIDTYIITTCITLLAAYSFILNIERPKDNILCYSIIISVFSLSMTLLGSLWHKVRWECRTIQFENEQKEIIHNSATEIARALEDFINPRFKLMAKQHVLDSIRNKNIEPFDKDKIINKISKEDHEPLMRLLLSFCKNMGTDIENAHKKYFLMPLQERFSKIKHLIDVFSKNTRYYFFTIGVLFFFISIMLNLLNHQVTINPKEPVVIKRTDVSL